MIHVMAVYIVYVWLFICFCSSQSYIFHIRARMHTLLKRTHSPLRNTTFIFRFAQLQAQMVCPYAYCVCACVCVYWKTTITIARTTSTSTTTTMWANERVHNEEGEDEGKNSNKKVNERDTKIKRVAAIVTVWWRRDQREALYFYQQRREKKESNKVMQGRDTTLVGVCVYECACNFSTMFRAFRQQIENNRKHDDATMMLRIKRR